MFVNSNTFIIKYLYYAENSKWHDADNPTKILIVQSKSNSIHHASSLC